MKEKIYEDNGNSENEAINVATNAGQLYPCNDVLKHENQNKQVFPNSIRNRKRK